MMEYANSSTLLSMAIGIGLFGWLAFQLWPRARREMFQQDLFKLRNDLFLFMWENDFGMNNPAYREVRNNLNGAIRLAETINVPMVIVVALFFRNQDKSVNIIDTVDDKKLRAELHSVMEKMTNRILWFLLFSPLGACAVAAFALYALARIHTWVPLTRLRPVRAFVYQARHGMAH